MKILIAGGSGFLGRALAGSLRSGGHEVRVLTRRANVRKNEIHWDGTTVGAWAAQLDEVDAVINVCGHSLASWPWTNAQKQRFLDSRVQPGRALAAALEESKKRPRVFIQASGINRYGLRGSGIADESSPAAGDFLAQLTVHWEDATKSIETLGVRRIVVRQAVVLANRGGLFPLMALPVRLFAGGPIGDGRQAVPWIHLADYVGAVRFLLESESAQGDYNLIAPAPTSNAEFMHAVAGALKRPYWLPTPAFALRLGLGEMSVLVTEGRYSAPKRLLDAGYGFKFGRIEQALDDLFGDR